LRLGTELGIWRSEPSFLLYHEMLCVQKPFTDLLIYSTLTILVLKHSKELKEGKTGEDKLDKHRHKYF